MSARIEPLSGALLSALLAWSCARPIVRQTTIGDARSPDKWLEGRRCQDILDGGEVGIEIIEPGLGSAVQAGETVRVHYVATLATGEKVRDTHVGPAQEMIVGSTRTICGFERGLAGMTPGEQRRVSVPWTLAFGEEGKAPVGPRADLVFVIDLYLPAGADSSRTGSSGRPPAAGGGGRRR